METEGGSILHQTPIQSYPSMSSNQRKKDGKKVWILIACGAAAVAAFLLFRQSATTTEVADITPTVTEITVEPTISEAVETTTTPRQPLQKSKEWDQASRFKNGSGTEGVAGKCRRLCRMLAMTQLRPVTQTILTIRERSIKAKTLLWQRLKD